MNTYLDDVRHAARALRRNPLFTCSIVMTLGLGVGVITGFFAIVDAVLLAPIAAHRDTVVRIWKHDTGRSIERFPLSYPELKLWRERASSFQALAAIGYANTSEAAVLLDREAVPVTIAPVSADFFGIVHGGSPLLGRWFAASDEGNATQLATVVSERFWQRASGGDPSFVGRRLLLPGGARALAVVGVAPGNLSYPNGTDLWVPLDGYFTSDVGIANFDLHSRRMANFHFLGRLAPGATVEQARAELDVISRGVAAQFPDDYRVMPVVVEPLLSATLGTARPLMLFLFAAASLVFLAAGGNVAALLLMRAATQARDIAVRVALGAGQFRIARQTLTESLMLGILGSMIGLLIAQLCVTVAKLLAAAHLPRLEFATIDARVLAFCVGATLVWVMTLGAIPLWRRQTPGAGQSAQQLSLRSTRSAALLRVMIVAQVTAAVVVAIAAGLLVRSFMHLAAVDRGFNAHNLAVVKLLLPDAQYPSPAARERFYGRLLPKLAALPGATGATTVHLGPGTGQAGLSARMIFDGQPPDQARDNPYGAWEPITPSYFATLGIPVIRGRAFTDADDGTAAPVSIVSESVAQRYWPGQDPIGKHVQLTAQFPWTTVVGVAADTRYRELTRDWLTVYFPAKQFFFFSPGALVVRTVAPSVALLAAIRRTIHEEEPAAAVHSVETMEKMVADETARQRTAVAIATLFALIAIVVSAIGVYGVVSYEVVHRARELAVRSALGASPRRLLGMTLRQSLSVAGTGAAIGLAAAVMLTRFLRTLLFEVSHLDLATFVLAGAGLLAIVLVASVVPAWRAARVNPALLLRSE